MRFYYSVIHCTLCLDGPLSSLQVRRKLLGLVGDNANATSVFGANFSAGFVAGSLAAAATCPLDVAKTRRQIEVFSFLNILPVGLFLRVKNFRDCVES